jgi:hypothetical protein
MVVGDYGGSIPVFGSIQRYGHRSGGSHKLVDGTDIHRDNRAGRRLGYYEQA